MQTMELKQKKVMIVDDEDFMFRLLELALSPFYQSVSYTHLTLPTTPYV